MDTAFFWLSKGVWTLIAPDSLLVLLLLLVWILLARGAIVWAKRLLGIVVSVLVVLSFLPVGEWLLYPLESRFATNPALPANVTGVIVLGGAEDALRSSVWQQAETNESAERFLASLSLARRFPQAKLLFTSGSGSVLDQAHKGASVAQLIYAENGLDPSRLVFESQSRNTTENAVLSKALVKPASGEVWILVTSAFHMPRSVGIFCRIGWPVIPFPVDHQSLPGHMIRADASLIGNLQKISTAVHEWLGLLAYYLTGKSSALFPEECRP